MIVISGITISNPADTQSSVQFEIMDESMNVLRTVQYTGQSEIYYQESSAGTYYIKITDGTSSEICEVTKSIMNYGDCFQFGLANGFIESIIMDSNNNYVIGGYFTTYSGISVNNIIRTNSSGIIDTLFSNNGTGFTYGGIEDIIENSDESYLIGGGFTGYSGQKANRIICLNKNGIINPNMVFGDGFNNIVTTIYKDNSGKYLIGGNFTAYSGQTANRIIRLNSDGSVDNTFNVGSGFNWYVYKILQQLDGKYLIVGNFGTFNDDPYRSNVVRLFSGGTIDESFNSGTAFMGAVTHAIIDSSGKYLIGGNYSSYNGTPIASVARIKLDGTIDDSFNSYFSGNADVRSIVENSDGSYMLGGSFSNYNNTSVNNIIRVFSNGVLDTSFQYTGSGFSESVRSILITGDKYIVGGYSTVGYSLCRLKHDGTLDSC